MNISPSSRIEVSNPLPVSSATLVEEAARATERLRGKVVEQVEPHRDGEFAIQFTDGTRVFVDAAAASLAVSIT